MPAGDTRRQSLQREPNTRKPGRASAREVQIRPTFIRLIRSTATSAA